MRIIPVLSIKFSHCDIGRCVLCWRCHSLHFSLYPRTRVVDSRLCGSIYVWVIVFSTVISWVVSCAHKQSSSTANDVSTSYLMLRSLRAICFLFFFCLFIAFSLLPKNNRNIFRRRWRWRQREKNLLKYAPFCLHTKSIRHKIQSAFGSLANGVGAVRRAPIEDLRPKNIFL